jgi:DNA-binding MarR family transcriptional regulator
MHMTTDGVVHLDDAFLRLRRLWSASRQRIIVADGRYVEMSTLLVVEACARGADRDLPVSVADVAVFADVAPSTASRLVDRAVTAGFVQRTLPTTGRRRPALTLTAAGVSLHQESLAARLRWLRHQLDGWPQGAVDDLAYLLTRFADTLDG